MGYHIFLKDSKFDFKKGKLHECYLAIQALHQGKGNDHYAWADNTSVLSATTLGEAFNAWRWGIVWDGIGGVERIEFNGEKYGDDDTLFDAIAPFVKSGSFIHMVGEDGEQWRWHFNGKTCNKQSAKIVWK